MAVNTESLVYQGKEGTGGAQIFPSQAGKEELFPKYDKVNAAILKRKKAEQVKPIDFDKQLKDLKPKWDVDIINRFDKETQELNDLWTKNIDPETGNPPLAIQQQVKSKFLDLKNNIAASTYQSRIYENRINRIDVDAGKLYNSPQSKEKTYQWGKPQNYVDQNLKSSDVVTQEKARQVQRDLEEVGGDEIKFRTKFADKYDLVPADLQMDIFDPKWADEVIRPDTTYTKYNEKTGRTTSFAMDANQKEDRKEFLGMKYDTSTKLVNGVSVKLKDWVDKQYIDAVEDDPSVAEKYKKINPKNPEKEWYKDNFEKFLTKTETKYSDVKTGTGEKKIEVQEETPAQYLTGSGAQVNTKSVAVPGLKPSPTGGVIGYDWITNMPFRFAGQENVQVVSVEKLNGKYFLNTVDKKTGRNIALPATGVLWNDIKTQLKDQKVFGLTPEEIEQNAADENDLKKWGDDANRGGVVGQKQTSSGETKKIEGIKWK